MLQSESQALLVPLPGELPWDLTGAPHAWPANAALGEGRHYLFSSHLPSSLSAPVPILLREQRTSHSAPSLLDALL